MTFSSPEPETTSRWPEPAHLGRRARAARTRVAVGLFVGLAAAWLYGSTAQAADEIEGNGAGTGEAEVQAPPAGDAATGDPPHADAPDADLIVYGDLEVAAQRQQLDRHLRAMDYRVGIRRGDTTVYHPESPWKPTIVVHDEGFIRLKRSPVRFAPPGQSTSDSKLRYLWCLPPFTPMCVRIGGVVVSDKKLQHQKTRIVEGTQGDVHAWTEAIVARNMVKRVGEDIPEQLDRLWRAGHSMSTPLTEDAQEPIAHPDRRRADMLTFWANRTCTPEGDAVAEVVSLFLEYEVQASPWPATPSEVAKANAATSCDRRLQLPVGPSLTTPLPPH
jgi:hypothetical protein